MNLIRPFAEQAVLDDMLKQAEAADEATATDKPTQRQDGKVCINQRDLSLGLEVMYRLVGFLSSLGCIDRWVSGGAYCVLAGRMRTAKSYLWIIQFKTKMR